MSLWRKKGALEAASGGVARSALAAAPREEWMRQAFQIIGEHAAVDRVGIWLEPELAGERAAQHVFRGMVWDRDALDVPSEWSHLSPEAPLPSTVLAGRAAVEVDFDASRQQTIFGPLLELRRALWVPIETQGRLRGILLAGTRRKVAGLDRQLPERVAAELALALEREEQQRLVRNAKSDIAFARKMLCALDAGGQFDESLQQIAAACAAAPFSSTGKPVDQLPSGPQAIFAAIGVLDGVLDESSHLADQPAAPRNGSGVPNISFLWTAGEKRHFDALQDGPLARIWHDAIETRSMVGGEIRIAATATTGRAVAIPLESQGKILGVLVAGLTAASASLITLERLELRAAVAASFLARRKEAAEQSFQMQAQRSALRESSQPALLLDSQGMALEMSRAALDLIGDLPGKVDGKVVGNVQPQRGSRPASLLGQPAARLFRPSERLRFVSWLQQRTSFSPAPAAEEFLELEFGNAQRVRVRCFVSAGAPSALLLLEPIGQREPAPVAENAAIELHHVIEWLEEGVILFDAHGKVRAMNMRFEQMAGLSAEESGKYQTLEVLIERLEPQAAEPLAFAERWRDLARGMDGAIREELQMVRPVPRILERSARPVLDSAGRTLGRVEIYRDLTAQRVFQSKLGQTEKLAALGQMLTGVAHELSNPLTTVLGYAQRLLAKKDGQSEEIRQIYQEAERAGRILRQLLSHARETPPERRNLSINQLVQRALELQRFSLASEKIRLELDLNPLLPLVRGDAGQLQQVFMNLLGNARQAIEQQGRGGTIRVRTSSDGEDRVKLVVEDTGPGVPQAIMARIFDPFFTTKPAGVGTGLGLSIVLNIVREHGGQVHVTNPQEGACFTVELPAVAYPGQAHSDSHDVQDDAEFEFREQVDDRATSRAMPAAAANGHSQRILVVEDESTVARLIADVLEDEGFAVSVLLDGREALDRATSEIFDLVICDMKMPGLDGKQFYKSLLRLGSPLGGRFLFVTGDSIGPPTHAFLTQYNLPYLSKPFRVDELVEHVRRALANRAPATVRAAVAAKKK